MNMTDDFVLGESDRDESELARVGRILLAARLDRFASNVGQVAHRVVSRAYDGEDIRREDIRDMRHAIEELELTLDEYGEPVVEDLVQREEVVDLADEYGEAGTGENLGGDSG